MDARQTHHASEHAIVVIEHLADRLRSRDLDFTHTSTILEIIGDVARSEQSRCLDAWIETPVSPSTDPPPPDDSLPF